MTRPLSGEELAAAIEAWLPALRMHVRLPAGLELALPTGECTIIIGTGAAIRQARHRAAKRDRKRNTKRDRTVVTERDTKRDTGNSDPDLGSRSGSGSGDLPLRIDQQEKLTGNARVIRESAHRMLCDLHAREYEKARGVPHKLSKGQGGRYGKAAAELLDAYGFTEACSIVRNALADEWQARTGPELWDIAKSASRHRGSVTPSVTRGVTSNGTRTGVQAALGYAAEVMAEEARR